MNPFQARSFIEQVINAPSMMAAQMMVDSNLSLLDTTFFQVLQAMIQEAERQGQFGPDLFSPNMPGLVADYIINQHQQSDQRVQALQMLYQYAASRKQQNFGPPQSGVPAQQSTQLYVTCQGCGQTQPVLCPGFGRHMPGPTVVASAQGGVCNSCGAQFTYVTCACGAVTYLTSTPDQPSQQQFDQDTDDVADESEASSDSSGSDDRNASQSSVTSQGEATSIQDLFGLLKEGYAQEKGKGNMDEVRQDGLDSLMERLGLLVEGDRPGQSLEEMTRDRGKLDEFMTEMMTRIKKPTFAGPELPADSRAARVLALLQELKAFVGAEGMKQQKGDSEGSVVMDLFARIARLTTSTHETRGDEQKLVALETDQARNLVNEVRLFARRHYPTLARPVWSHGNVPLDPNFIFFSGSDQVRQRLERASARLGLEVNRPTRLGADIPESRWQDLRAASLGVFDISSATPQVFYELGIALTLGTELLIIAQRQTKPPFDVAQNIRYYSDEYELDHFLALELDASLYGLQCRGSDGSSLADSVAYAERLAAAVGDDGLLHVALESLRKVHADPVAFAPACKLLNTFFRDKAPMILYPRWPGVYPDPMHPRCFIVMHFDDALEKIHQTIVGVCKQAGIQPIRGDVAEGQEIIKSIWEEIGKATHVAVDLTGFNPNVCLELGIADALGRRTLLIGPEGTDKLLQDSFPGIAKRRCHTYPSDPLSKSSFADVLTRFLNEPFQL